MTSAEYETFEEPVPVFVGLGYLTRIETVSQAYALLSDWPCGQRDPAHAAALNACKAALARESIPRRRGVHLPLSRARKAFWRPKPIRWWPRFPQARWIGAFQVDFPRGRARPTQAALQLFARCRWR